MSGITKQDWDQVVLFRWIYERLNPFCSPEERFAQAIVQSADNSQVMRAMRSEGLTVKEVIEKAEENERNEENFLDVTT